MADCGHGKDDVKVVNLVSGKVIQTLPLPGCYGGVAFAPGGRRRVRERQPNGSSPTEGPTKGDQGDVIHIFTVDPETGKGVEQNPMQLPATAGGSGRLELAAAVSGVGTAQPEGIAVSPNGHYLVVALNAADQAVVIDLPTRRSTLVSVGQYPNGVAFDPRGRAYVSNEYSGTLSVIDPASAKVTAHDQRPRRQPRGSRQPPGGDGCRPKRPALYVAVTNRDLVAVVNTRDASGDAPDLGRPAAGLGTAPIKRRDLARRATLYAVRLR